MNIWTMIAIVLIAIFIVKPIVICLFTATLAYMFQGAGRKEDRHWWIWYFLTFLKQIYTGGSNGQL